MSKKFWRDDVRHPYASLLQKFLSDLELFEPYSDRDVINHEGRFVERFGWGFDCSTRRRHGLIQIKQDLDLTDRQLKWMRRTGFLCWKSNGFNLTATRSVGIWGWTFVSYNLALVVALSVSVCSRIADFHSRVSCLDVSTAFMLITTTACMFCLFLVPRSIQARLEQEMGFSRQGGPGSGMRAKGLAS